MQHIKWLTQGFLWLALAGLALTACASALEPAAGAAGNSTADQLVLDDGVWTLIGYGSADSLTTPPAPITLQFKDGQLTGNAACNAYGGAYNLVGRTISFPNSFYQTERGCEEPLMAFDQRYLADLGAVTTLARAGDTLTLTHAAGVLVFRLAAAITDAPLEGGTWQLDSFIEGDVASHYSDVTVTARFEAGQITGSAGCNSYFADYTLAGERLTFGPVGATRMACEDNRMAVETRYLAALDSAESYTISGHTLTLNYAGGALRFQLVDNR